VTSRNEYNPDFVSPPGDTVEDIIEERELNVTQLAKQLGLTKEEFDLFLAGNKALIPELAELLQTVLGSSRAFWLERERQYRRFIDGCVEDL
jgi:HTH-type transcriptional regulator/antitoxin HigA